MKRQLPDYTNSQIRLLIDENIHNEKWRAILKRRLIDGVCFEPLAEEFDMSVRGMKGLFDRAEKELFKRVKL